MAGNEDWSADVVPLFKEDRTCFECVHHADVSSWEGVSSYCLRWEQPIESERYEAEDCSQYEKRKAI